MPARKKPIVIDGIEYPSFGDAAQALSTRPNILRRLLIRIADTNFDGSVAIALAARSRHRQRRIPAEQVAEIRAASGSTRQIATQFGVSRQTVSNIRRDGEEEE